MTSVTFKTIIATIISITLFSCNGNQQKNDKPVITVSILPQEYFVRQIAGDHFSINVMIPPGASPATYEPTPSQLAELSRADLYLKMGYTGFEMAWMDKITASNQQMEVVNLSDGIDLITEGTMQKHDDAIHINEDQQSEHNHEQHQQNQKDAQHDDGQDNINNKAHQHSHHHGGIDPHTWLSPRNAEIIAKNIYQALSVAYPNYQDTFIKNLESFQQSLNELDLKITNTLKDFHSRAFFTYHPALSYFSRDYNLEQYPLELAGKTPSTAHLRNLIDIGKEKEIKTVFLQMQFDQKNAEVLAKEIDAEIVQINPLDPEWYDQMIFITNKIKENFQ